MMVLDPGCANTLRGGVRPRTTLSPTIAMRGGRPDRRAFAFGSPGGDGQDQWSLSFFLRHVHHGMGAQQAIDHPSFSSDHWPSSFGGRAYPLAVKLEGRFPPATASRLEAMGHKVRYEPGGWGDGQRGEGVLVAVGWNPPGESDGGKQLFGAAHPRGGTAYAAGR